MLGAYRTLLTIIFLLALGACADPPPDEDQHAAAEEEEELYAMAGLDHGLIQSPVNILTSETSSGRHEIRMSPGRSQAENVTNTGHSVQLDFKPGATVYYDDKAYDFKQCHFHTPSEHQVDGVTYPMELHCVSLIPPSEGSDAPPEYLVVGFLFKMGAESLFISEFLSQVPESEASVHLDESEPVFIDDLVGEMEGEPHFYSYRGSLTTPPYSESVSWLVVEHIFEASPQQIGTINRLEGNNARHVQALYGREVEAN